MMQALPNPADDGYGGMGSGGGGSIAVDDSMGYPTKGYIDDSVASSTPTKVKPTKVKPSLPGDWYYSDNGWVCSPTFGCVPIPDDVNTLPIASANDGNVVVVQPLVLPNQVVSNDIVADSSSNVIAAQELRNLPVVNESGQKVGIIQSDGAYASIDNVTPGTDLYVVLHGQQVPIVVDSSVSSSGEGQVLAIVQQMDNSGNLVPVVVDGNGNLMQATPEQIAASKGNQASIVGSVTDAVNGIAKSLGITSSDGTSQLTTDKTTILLATGIAAIGILYLMFKK
jgi:hypothetical protein